MFNRAFLAIPVKPPEAMLLKVEQLRRVLVHENLRWVDPKNWHVTLYFFGDIEIGEVHELGNALRIELADFRMENLYYDHTGYFMQSGNPVVLWFGFKDDLWINQLHYHVSKVLKEKMPVQNKGKFTPHVTIARMKRVKDFRRFRNVVDEHDCPGSGVVRADEVVFFESRLTPHGSIYNEIIKIPLVE